jgi:hypothetical protein
MSVPRAAAEVYARGVAAIWARAITVEGSAPRAARVIDEPSLRGLRPLWVAALLGLSASCQGPPRPAADAGHERDASPALAPPPDRFFEDVTAQSGLRFERAPEPGTAGLPDRAFGAVCVIDVDGRAPIDLFFATRRASRLFVGQASLRYANETEARGLADVGDALGCLAFDEDGDGDDDLVVSALGEVRLYRNDGGTFVDDSARLGPLRADAIAFGGLSAGDADADGDLDLLVAGYLEWDVSWETYGGDGPPPPAARNWLLQRGADGRYDDATAALAPQLLVLEYTLVVAFADFDGDGADEIFVGNDFGLGGFTNRVLRRTSAGDYADVGVELGLANAASGWGISAMGFALDDLDGDGRLDALVSDEPGHATTLHRCDGVLCLDEGPERGTRATEDTFRWGIAAVDVDLDGDMDVVEATGHLMTDAEIAEALEWIASLPPDVATENTEFLRGAELQAPNLLLNDGTGHLRLASYREGEGLAALGSHRGLAVTDLDEDGAPDLVLAPRRGAPLVLRNLWARTGHWLRVRLIGDARNREAAGAVVRVSAGERTWIDERTVGGEGYAGNHDRRFFFGLGANDTVDVEVLWPDGASTRRSGVRVDREIEITR